MSASSRRSGFNHVWRLALLWAALVACCASASAAQRALLVGVSELIHQPPSLWLQAPRNDVQLMRKALLEQGWAASDIVTLADGVAGAEPPNAIAIQRALQALLERSSAGDFVLLYFSGHGTRARDPAKRYEEPDGLAEIFLARDVRGRMGAGASPQGGMKDVEFDAWVNAFQARNVFVWAVFDTCSSTSMTRSLADRRGSGPPQDPDDEVRFRGVRANELTGGGMAAVVEVHPPAVRQVAKARYVAFFAAESHQLTPELRLPRRTRAAPAQGLLTWAISEALKRRPATWRELFEGTLALYPPIIDELQQRFPTREMPSPVAEGALDAALFANHQAAAASTLPAWSAQRTGAMLNLGVGALDGLEIGLPLAVSAQGADGTARTARTQAGAVELGSSQLPVPAPLAGLPGIVAWRVSPLGAPQGPRLRVQADGVPVRGLNLEYPAGVELVRTDAADVRLRRTSGGISFEPAGGTARLLASGEEVARELERAAALKWFEHLTALPRSNTLEGVSAALDMAAGDRVFEREPLTAAPSAGQARSLEIVNTSGTSIDLLVLAVDATGWIHPVFPGSASETNRFESGDRQSPASKRFALPHGLGLPGSRLVVVATPAKPWRSARLFGASAIVRESGIRLRGQSNPDRDQQAYAVMARW